MRNYAETCRRARSSSPDIAFPALQRLGRAYSVTPTTDSGFKLYGAGRLGLPAETNYCTHPSFEVDTNADGFSDGWEEAHSTTTAATFTRPLNLDGTYAQRMIYTGASDVSKVSILRFWVASGFSVGETVTVSASIKGAVSGCSPFLKAQAWTAADAFLNEGQLAISPISSSVRYSVTYTLPATTAKVTCAIFVSAIDTGDIFDLTTDDVLIEKSATLTPYFDGDYPGCAWTGTADASTSTRTVSALTIPVALGSVGFTVAGRYSALWAHNDSAAHNLLTLYAGADARATVYKHTDQKLYASVYDGTDTVTSASAAQTLAVGTVNRFVARSTWASTVDLDLNGTASTQGDASAVAAQDITAIGIGGTPVSYIGPLIISPVRAADAYITAQQANSGALYADVMGCVELARRYNLQPFLTLPLQSDSVGWVVTE